MSRDLLLATAIIGGAFYLYETQINSSVQPAEQPVEEPVVEQNKAEQNKEVIEQIQTALCLIFDKLNEMKLNQ